MLEKIKKMNFNETLYLLERWKQYSKFQWVGDITTKILRTISEQNLRLKK